MDFKHLKTFRVAARTLNFSEAASELHYVQSAVTAHIRTLESELNVRLFDRNGRGVRLTSAGEQLLGYADRLFALRDEAEQSVRQSADIRGEITVAGYETVLTYRLPAILKAFGQQHPDVRINLVSLNVSQLQPHIQNQQIDVAFTLDDQSYHFEPSQSLARQCLRQEKVAVICHPDHPLAARKQVTAADLQKETILLTEPGCHYRKVFEQALKASHGFRGHRMEFMSLEAIKSCIKLDMGIAAISEVSVIDELNDGSLAQLNWKGADLTMNLNVLWNDKRWLSPAMKAFLKAVSRFSGHQ